MKTAASFGPCRAPEDEIVMHQTYTTVTWQNPSMHTGLAMNGLAVAVTDSFSTGRKYCKAVWRAV